MRDYMVSVVAPAKDAEGHLDGDVIVVEGAEDKRDAESKVRAQLKDDPARADWSITDATPVIDVDPDEILPADYEVQR